ncbi:twin transmembrane helix small protein [Roseobacter sp. HKCCA0434]|uniref:twin transmembrane helix small protein n=1 Tax=Roseobacter sp. HKCCA0434 TaxID=3079297 RepID=UPI002905B04A|nr:twin transmembrane helix small protein [Roseobacter sp. HKCCA0434]
MVTGLPLYIIGIACIAVLVVLLIGVGGFAKGGDFNKKHANRIMRLRILLQFIAVIVIVGAVWFARNGG